MSGESTGHETAVEPDAPGEQVADQADGATSEPKADESNDQATGEKAEPTESF